MVAFRIVLGRSLSIIRHYFFFFPLFFLGVERSFVLSWFSDNGYDSPEFWQFFGSSLLSPVGTLVGLGAYDYTRRNKQEILDNGLVPTIGNDIGSDIDAGIDLLLGPNAPNLSDLGDLGDLFDKPGTPTPRAPFKQPTFDYLEAELAKFYGMDRNTAYQEALSNTAYQRAVMDMQRAGLNPAAIFGGGRGQGASGVAYVSSGGSSYSGSAKDAKLFSSEDFGLIASLAGLATAVATKKPSNFWLGQQGAQAVMQVLNGLDRKFK